MTLHEHVPHPHLARRREAGPVKVADQFSHLGRFNEGAARRITLAFGTMWAAYLFFAYGLLPLLDPGHITEYLYWSNVVQLVALPVLAVGAAVLGRATDKQARQQFDDVEALLHEQAEQAAHLAAQDEKILAILAQLQANTALTEQVKAALVPGHTRTAPAEAPGNPGEAVKP